MDPRAATRHTSLPSSAFATHWSPPSPVASTAVASTITTTTLQSSSRNGDAPAVCCGRLRVFWQPRERWEVLNVCG
jgi:hypothetical protein